MMDNGLWVVHRELPNPLVAISIHQKGGSSVEKPHETGSAHFLEHMVFKASKKYPSEEIISGLIEQEGAHTNAFTSHDRICFYIQTQSKVELMFDILADGIMNPLFRDEDIAVERGAVLQEIAGSDDEPDDLLKKLYSKMIWGAHPFGGEILGTAEEVSTLARETFANFHAEYFTPGNSVLAVIGGISAEKTFEYARKYFLPNFGQGSAKLAARSVLPEINFGYVPPRKLFAHEKDFKQLKCLMGTLPQPWLSTMKKNEKEKTSAVLMGMMLGGGFSSRLFTKVRTQKGLVYGIGAGVVSLECAGNFWIQFGSDPSNAVSAITIILDELDSFLNTGTTVEELEKVKNLYKTSVALAAEKSRNVAFFMGQTELQGLPLCESQDYFAKVVDPVTVSDIMEVAKKILPKSNFYTAILGPAGEHTNKLDTLLS